MKRVKTYIAICVDFGLINAGFEWRKVDVLKLFPEIYSSFYSMTHR